TALDSSLADLNAKARAMALELADYSDASQITQLSRLRDQSQLQEALIVTSSNRVVASAGGNIGSLVPELPTANMLSQARLTRGFAAIEGSSEGLDRLRGGKPQALEPGAGLRLRVVVAIPGKSSDLSLQNEARFLQLMLPVPQQLAADAEALRAAYSEYQARSVGRTGLRKIYIVTLTLTLLLAIFGAVTSAFVIANDLAQPLLLLAEGTKAVAEGNLSPRPIVATSDELGTLTQSFNTMTRQLFDARAAVERNRTELENAKAYLESVLANMSAGVMVLDGQFRLMSCNESVDRILQHDFEPHLGQPLSEIDGLSAFADVIIRAFTEQSAKSAGENGNDFHWQQQIEIPRSVGDAEVENNITLLARGSRLPVDSATGYVVVFDDISDVISGQRSIAWGEVARRLAHEIKNPLTPIQLSAERIRRKFGKVITEDKAVFEQCTETIVRQVDDIRRMVDEFSRFARMPKPVIEGEDVADTVRQAVFLMRVGHPDIEIHADIKQEPMRAQFDRRLISQALTNIIKNATEAIEAVPPGELGKGRIEVIAAREHEDIVIDVVDNGIGLPKLSRARLLEPYVTTREKGTGLGLAIVGRVLEDHGGRIELNDAADIRPGQRGAWMRLRFAVSGHAPKSEEGASETKPSAFGTTQAVNATKTKIEAATGN
ncbi:MAG: ATP-binding protein, partial [Bradyrhizobium sp.]